MYKLIHVVCAVLAVGCLAVGGAHGQSAGKPTLSPPGSLLRQISGESEKLELTTNSSRILTLGKKIPRVQVNNPELLAVTPLSATQVQVSAKKAGVTQVNLWDEDGTIHTVDVFIYGDVRELEHALATQFPNSSIRVYRYSNALVLNGFIDRPDYVTPIVELAQDYSPKVINNISVGGVQQVLLKVKVFEVSRTKLRQLGIDFAAIGTSGNGVVTSAAGLLATGTDAAVNTILDTGGNTVTFGVSSNGNQLLGFLNALEENNVAKVLAEPNLVAVSGRPARFNSGGETPIIIPQGFGQFSIEYRPFGTQVDFLPIVLGNGNIRLEVRPRVSDLDEANGVQVNDTIIPGFTVREVDTAVEMKAGQTFALAGLIQRSTVGLNRGLPGLANLPVLGIPFRTVSEDVNEIELLIVVTPEFVDPLDPHQAPQCLPGEGTMSPNNRELYRDGRIEVRNTCNQCGQHGCVRVHGHEPCCPPTYGASSFGVPGIGPTPIEHGAFGHNASVGEPVTGIDPEGAVTPVEVAPRELTPQGPSLSSPAPTHEELRLPPLPSNYRPQTTGVAPGGTIENGFVTPRQPQYQRAASAPQPRAGLIGPVGYDDE